MTFFKSLWRYWTWVCVALLTTAAALYVLAAAIDYFKPVTINDDRPQKCLDMGGTWDADENLCRTAA